MYEQPNQPSLLNLFGTVMVFLIITAYGFVALNTEDAMWFWPKFEEVPQAITVYCYGQSLSIEPTSSDFTGVTQLVNNSLSGRKNWDSLSMSDETYTYYQSHPEALVVELEYTRPVRIHSIYKYFSNVRTLVIPLDGRHSQTNAVFGRNGENITAGSLHVHETNKIMDFLNTQGVCTSQ